MVKSALTLGLILFFIFLIPAIGFSDEQLTITTYYPSPYGSYAELRAQQMAIGNAYFGPNYCWGGGCANIIDANADLVVEGNVGIRTTGPIQPLHVFGAGGWGNNVAGAAVAQFAITSTGNTAAVTSLKTGSGSSFDTMLFAAGATPANAALINQRNNAPLRLMTNDIDRIYIEGGGNVGIGTTAPTQKLVVQDGNVVIGNLDPSGMGRRLIFTNNPNENYIYVDGWWMKFHGAMNEGFRWENGVGTEKMRLELDTGNLGIGTNDPQDRLEVNGMIRVSRLGAAGSPPGTYLCRNASGQIADCPGAPFPSIYTRSCTAVLPAKSCTANCDSTNDRALGGGGTTNSVVALTDSVPFGTPATGWQCTSQNSQPTCYVVCADLTP